LATNLKNYATHASQIKKRDFSEVEINCGLKCWR